MSGDALVALGRVDRPEAEVVADIEAFRARLMSAKRLIQRRLYEGLSQAG
jgi:hypothetical protein